MEVADYYNDRHVRSRMTEFLGGKTLDSATCMFITECDAATELGNDFKIPTELDSYLTRGFDVSRSLWDKEWLIAHLDIEYVNFDFPAEPYLDPIRTFQLQKPAESAIEKILLDHGIAPLHMLSGRGHHFVWKINRDSTAFGKLTQIGRLPLHLEQRYSSPLSPICKPIERDLGAAFAGLGLIMEYVALRVKERADKSTEIPVDISAVEVPPQKRGREMVSLDITEYGDLLNTRLIRVPFSMYLKPWQKGGILHEEIKDKVPSMVSIPLYEMSTFEGVAAMRDLEKAVELASRAPTQIPDQTFQMLDLLHSYEISDIADIHDWFYSEEHELPEMWPRTYDRTPLELLPPCTRYILQNPNDLLLKPAGMRQVTRVLLSLGWHPRHIAGLIRSKFERNYGWGREWYFYDAATRADFYTRVFTAMVKTGLDKLDFFDCTPVKDLQNCGDNREHCKLEEFKFSLLERVKNERLAGRPFNGLFLPT